MRPKIVIITLLLGVGALVLIGVLHEKLGKPLAENPVAGSGGVPAELTNTPTVELAKPEVSPIQPEVKLAVTNVIATTTDEDHAAQKEKDLEAISAVLVSGDDAGGLFAIASRLENEDAEVREAAREAAVHLGNTNVIPHLASALEHLKDPREKVAIMDAIAYLQLPTAPEIPSNGMAPPTPSPMPIDKGARTNTGGRTKAGSATPGQPPTAPGAP